MKIIVLSSLLIIVFCVIILFLIHVWIESKKGRRICLSMVLLACSIGLTGSVYVLIDTIATRVNLPILIFSVIVPTMVYVTIVMYRINSYQQTLILKEERIRNTSEKYEAIKEEYKKNAARVHDMRHHLRLIKDMAEKKEADLIVNYIDELSFISEESNELFTGIDIADIIISDTVYRGKERGIIVTVEADILPAENRILQSDYCSVFANILENALEAAKKFIQIKVKKVNRMIFVHVDNDCMKDPIVQNGRIMSTKSNLEDHGHGLQIVKTICEKYNGTARFSYENGCFSVELMMCI